MTFQSEHPDISFTEFLIYAFELTSKWRQFNVRAFCKFFKITQQKIQKMPPGLTSLEFYCNIQEVESKCKQPSCFVSTVQVVMVWGYFLSTLWAP